MADVLAVVSKAVFEPEARKHRLEPGRVWSTNAYVSQNKGLQPLADGGRLFLVTVRPPDEALWLVAVLEAPKSDGKQWGAAVNVVPVRDVSGIKRALKFANGQGLPDKAGVLGMSLQTPRVLVAADVPLLLGGDAPVVAAPVVAAPAPAPKPKKARKVAEPPPEPEPPPPEPAAAPVSVGASFEEVVEAWRRTRHPRYAAVAESLSAREPARPELAGTNKKADVDAWLEVERASDWRDMPRLLASLTKCHSPTATERVSLIARRDDPRVVPALLKETEDPPYTAGTSRHFWRAVVRALGSSNDVRARDKMLQLSTRYKLINDTVQGANIARDLNKTASEMKIHGPLSAADLRTVAALETTLGITPPSSIAPAPTEATKNAASLFEAIVGAPDDDDARLIYADVLSEKGEDRGEFIVLQVERAAGRGSPERSDLEREKFNKTDRVKEFAIPISAAASAVKVERGFPVEVQLQGTGLTTVASAPEWGTVRRLLGIGVVSERAGADFLNNGAAKNLLEVSGVSTRLLSKLKASTLPWTRVRFQAEGLTPDSLKRVPKLTHVELALNFGVQASIDSQIFDAAPELVEVTFGEHANLTAPVTFARNPKLKSLVLGRYQTSANHPNGPDFFRGVAVPKLSMWGTVRDAAAWLDAMPNVRDLVMLTTNPIVDVMAVMKEFPRLERLEFGIYNNNNARRFAVERIAGGGFQLVVLPVVGQFWRQVEDEAGTGYAQLHAREITKLVLHPTKPRHERAALDPAVVERIRAEWGADNVTTPELL